VRIVVRGKDAAKEFGGAKRPSEDAGTNDETPVRFRVERHEKAH
jgi:hypothetical protein